MNETLFNEELSQKSQELNGLRYIGVDPGISGGIAVVHGLGQAEAHKMPATERDIWMLFLDESLIEPPPFALIERVHSMPRQGVASSFKFGMNYGFLRACLHAAGIPFEEITPHQWQTKMKCKTGGDKNVSKARAQQLFPNLKITHAIADALLLAECCRRMKNGEL